MQEDSVANRKPLKGDVANLPEEEQTSVRGNSADHHQSDESKEFEEFVKSKGGPEKIGSKEIAEWIARGYRSKLG